MQGVACQCQDTGVVRENDGTPTVLKVAIQPAEVLYQKLGLYAREERKGPSHYRRDRGWEGWGAKEPFHSSNRTTWMGVNDWQLVLQLVKHTEHFIKLSVNVWHVYTKGVFVRSRAVALDDNKAR